MEGVENIILENIFCVKLIRGFICVYFLFLLSVLYVRNSNYFPKNNFFLVKSANSKM